MELSKPLVSSRPDAGRLGIDLANVDAAIELVRRRTADRVRLAGLDSAERLAPLALAKAQAAGVRFVLDRDGGSVTLTFGPLD
jgi:hypothetical protein